jgi:hypothetical protein
MFENRRPRGILQSKGEEVTETLRHYVMNMTMLVFIPYD